MTSTSHRCALPAQGLTAYGLAHFATSLSAGHTALVHAAAGGVGALLVQLLCRRGVRVLGTASTPEKQALVREAGAIPLPYGPRLPDLVRAANSGRGVDAVFDSVGLTTQADSLAVLSLYGHLVYFGEASGPPAPISPEALYERNLRVSSFWLAADPLERWNDARRELQELVTAGLLRVTIGTTFPLGLGCRRPSSARAAPDARQADSTSRGLTERRNGLVSRSHTNLPLVCGGVMLSAGLSLVLLASNPSLAGPCDLLDRAAAGTLAGAPVSPGMPEPPEPDDETNGILSYCMYRAPKASVIVSLVAFPNAGDAKKATTKELVAGRLEGEQKELKEETGLGEKSFWAYTEEGAQYVVLKGANVIAVSMGGGLPKPPASYHDALRAAAASAAGKL